MYILSEFKIHEANKEIFINKLLSECNIKNLQKIYGFFLYESNINNMNIEKILRNESELINYNNDNFLKKEILIRTVNEIKKTENYYHEMQNLKKILLLKKDSNKFYLKKSLECKDLSIKNISLFFADTEYNHIFALEYMINSLDKEKIMSKKKLIDKVLN